MQTITIDSKEFELVGTYTDGYILTLDVVGEFAGYLLKPKETNK